jgi:predicted phosphodiesterase
MRVAALYDIHGNLPALEAVLEEIERVDVDRVVVGGDVCPGPFAREALDRLLALNRPVRFIRGNGDREVVHRLRGGENSALPADARAAIRFNAEELGDDYGPLIAAWPLTITLAIPPLGNVLFCHATPRNDTEIFTRLTSQDRLAPVFAGVDAAIVVCGHTHMQFDRMVGNLRVVNAGSVGMPFGEAGAHWLLLGSDVELRRTPYDLDRAAERIGATRYPRADEFASQYVLQRPTEEYILDVFSRAELSGS